MALESILFWLFAILAVGGGVGVVVHPNPVKSALFLVVTFFALAGEYVLLMAHFVAIVHIAVYAGAIMVLFLFVIMLLNVQEETRLAGVWGFMRYFSIVLFVALFVQLGYFGYQGFFGAENVPMVQETEIGTVEQIGTALFSKYVLPFEIASILLLTAMIGALYLSKQKLTLGEPARAAKAKAAQHEKEEAH